MIRICEYIIISILPHLQVTFYRLARSCQPHISQFWIRPPSYRSYMTNNDLSFLSSNWVDSKNSDSMAIRLNQKSSLSHKYICMNVTRCDHHELFFSSPFNRWSSRQTSNHDLQDVSNGRKSDEILRSNNSSETFRRINIWNTCIYYMDSFFCFSILRHDDYYHILPSPAAIWHRVLIAMTKLAERSIPFIFIFLDHLLLLPPLLCSSLVSSWSPLASH